MRRTHRVMAALALTSGALGACNLITGLNADYSASAFDARAASSAEGGSGDGPGSDDAGGGDSPGTGELDADAGLVSWCRRMQDGAAEGDFFCTDFEDASFPVGGGTPAGWSRMTNAPDAGTLSFVEVDGSRALEVLGTSTGSAGANTRLLKDLAGSPTADYAHYELQYDFRVLATNLQYAAIGLLTFATFSVATKEHGLAVYGPGPPQYLSQQGGNGALSNKVVVDGLWHHARVTLDRTQANAYARTIVIDTSTNVDGDDAGHTLDPSDPTNISLGVFNAAAFGGTARVQFDNVVFWRWK